jgi:hypothetical protein
MQNGKYVPIGTALVRIDAAVSGDRDERQFTIGDLLPPSGSFLWLGYEDDDYTDNGYANQLWSSARGSNDGQCNGRSDASVEIEIRRKSLTAEHQGVKRRPFDLAAETLDDNGLLCNPEWHGTRESTFATYRRDCFVYRDKLFPWAGIHYTKRAESESASVCTTQAPYVDQPVSIALLATDPPEAISVAHKMLLGGITCPAGGALNESRPGMLFGHVNWVPATLSGTIYFEARNIDNDYDLKFVADTRLPTDDDEVSSNHEYGVEFDARETVDRFTSGAWAAINGTVNQGRIPEQLSGKRAIVTGLLGLDCEHSCRNELHPVFLLAVRANADELMQVGARTLRERWVIFARNWGNQGYCSQDIHFLGRRGTVSIRLPAPARIETRAALHEGRFILHQANARSYPGESWWHMADVPARGNLGQGALLTFNLQHPHERHVVSGEITIDWTIGDASRHDTLLQPAKRAPKPKNFEQRLLDWIMEQGGALLKLVEHPKAGPDPANDFELQRRQDVDVTRDFVLTQPGHWQRGAEALKSLIQATRPAASHYEDRTPH